MKRAPSDSLPLGELLRALRADGFAVGIDDHVRLGKLAAMDADWTRARIRTAVCAVVAKDPKERERVGELFDRCYGAEKRRQKTVTAATEEAPRSVRAPARPRRWGLVAALGVIAAGAVAWAVLRSPEPAAVVRSRADVSDEPIEVVAAPEEPTVPAAAYWLGGAGAVALAGALALRGGRRRRQQRFAGAPYRYERQVPAARGFYHEDEIEDAAAFLTWRMQEGGSHALDVTKSLARTVAAGGCPTIVYAPPPPAPTYAVLEDVSGGGWRPLITELLARLERAGVRMQRFLFDGEPEPCVAKEGGRRYALEEIAEHADALLVVGDGALGWDPLEARERPWVSALGLFPRRLWLNPLPPARWSAGARAIARTTAVEHATVTALARLQPGVEPAEHERAPYPAVIERAPGSALALAALREHLGPRAFRCLELLALAGDGAGDLSDTAWWLVRRFEMDLEDGDRLRLFSLPWLGSGRWPAGLRERLVAELEREQPELARQARRAVLELVDASEPPSQSAAHLRWRLDRAKSRIAAGDAAAERDLAMLAATPLHAEAARALGVLGRPEPGRRLVAGLATGAAAALVSGGSLAAWALLPTPPLAALETARIEPLPREPQPAVPYDPSERAPLLGRDVEPSYAPPATTTAVDPVQTRAEPPAAATLDQTTIRDRVRPVLPTARACYETELQIHPDAAGTVVVHFVIGTNGRAHDVRANGKFSTAMLDCIKAPFRALTFPRADEPVETVYPITFAPEQESTTPQTNAAPQKRSRKKETYSEKNVEPPPIQEQREADDYQLKDAPPERKPEPAPAPQGTNQAPK